MTRLSRFLGPIHHWLFNKIRVFEETEEVLILELKEKGLDVDNVVNSMRHDHGDLIGEASLEELIDTDNIHGWLQEKIRVVETRQAAIISKLMEKHGDMVLDVAKDVYCKMGRKYGEEVQGKNIKDAPTLYKALNNYILEGMPCDNVNSVIEKDDDHIVWNAVDCLHKNYWEAVDGDVQVYYTLRTGFINNFIETANEEFSYTFSIEKNNGLIIMRNVISK